MKKDYDAVSISICIILDVSNDQGKVREIPDQAKVREIQGNRVYARKKIKLERKVRDFLLGTRYEVTDYCQCLCHPVISLQMEMCIPIPTCLVFEALRKY